MTLDGGSPAVSDASSATEARQRDAERSKKAILKAAQAEFAERGLGGARLDRIAEQADVDKRLVYYYFKNKDNLFAVVLEEAYRHIRQAELQLALDHLSPIEAIRQLTVFTWEYYEKNPAFLTLINSENLHKARHLRQSERRIGDTNAPLVQMLEQVLERGRAEGVFRAGVDPVQLYITICGICYIYFSNMATLSVVFQRDLNTTRAKQERVSHVCDVVLGYLLRN